MSFEDIRRNIVSAQLLTQLAAEHGVAVDPCLQDTGITLPALASPDTWITAAQELQLVRNLLRELGHVPGLGLDAGLRYHLSTYGILGFAMLSSPSLRSGADTAIRYLGLAYVFVRYRVDACADRYRIVLDHRGVPADVVQFFIEREFAALLNAMQEMLPGKGLVRAVQFDFPRPAYAERFGELCGVEPRFDAPDSHIEIDPALVDAPLPQSAGVMARMCLEQCRQLLEKRKLRPGVAGRVREQVLLMSGQIPTLEIIASKLHMAPRSLRRQLEREGTSFRTLVEEVLETLAVELLTTAHLKLEEVAERLGYSEPAAFTHAFKRWKGMSPNAFREQSRL